MNRRDFLALDLAALGVLGLTGAAALLPAPAARAADLAPSFTFPGIEGETYDTAQWRGRPVLVVNTASLCGFAPQLEDMQALHDRLAPRGLVVLAVPSDDFAQELASGAEAKSYCALTFGIDLPMTDIVHVRRGDLHPFYRWLKDTHGFVPQWNFNKVLLDGQGQVVGTWGALTKPGARPIVDAITPLLPQG